MLMGIACEINDNVIYGVPGWRELRDKYLKLRDQYTGQYILAPYILIDLSRREDANSKSLTAKHAKMIADHLNEVNGVLAPYTVEDLEWWRMGVPQSKPALTAEQAKLVANNMGDVRKFAEYVAKGNQELIAELEAFGLQVLEELAPKYDPTRRGFQGRKATFRTFASWRLRGAMIDFVKENKNRTVAVGGAKEVDIASRCYREQPKPLTWDEATNARTRTRGRIRMSRPLPSGDMTIINRLLLKLNRRQRVVYQGMVLDDPPRTRAEIARQLNIRHLNAISRIRTQAQDKMNKWLLGIEHKPK